MSCKNFIKKSSEGSMRSKYSSKGSKSLSSLPNMLLKSSKSLFKLCQGTEKAKRKLELIKRRQELEETETLNVVAEAKEKLHVAQMLETVEDTVSKYEDTVSKHRLSVKSESAANHHLKTTLNPNKTTISSSTPPIQSVKTFDLDPGVHILFPKIQMIKSKGIIFKKTSVSNPHTQCPNMKFVCPRKSYPKDRLGVQVNDSSLSIHPTNCIDDFIDRLLEAEETVLPGRDPIISTAILLQLEYESVRVLDGEAKQTVVSIGSFDNRNPYHSERYFESSAELIAMLALFQGS